MCFHLIDSSVNKYEKAPPGGLRARYLVSVIAPWKVKERKGTLFKRLIVLALEH